MLVALGFSIYYISDALEIESLWGYLGAHDNFQIFFFEDYKSSDFFFKQFISGMFIAIVMTGLDQDMMQKNLTCRTLKDAQKNIFWFTLVLTVVNFLFLLLGLLLTDFADVAGINEIKDDLFPAIATSGVLGVSVAITFILGLIAAAYSSADSALTSLTTSISIDILDIQKRYSEASQTKVRQYIHIIISLVLIAVMMIFKYAIEDKSVINKLFEFAGYTYGPLLGLYAFGLFTKWEVKDKWVPVIAILSPVLSYILSQLSFTYLKFEFGFFILILNGLLTFLGLILIRRQKNQGTSF
jgi:Na+/proline symporter